mmetsp:Transcript_78830/g.239092  ORF Transcript_78830/g.239092 Transcript_78830/m.239092 type:complete len:358 (+) Transcript_78830:97-1170(+)
MSQPVYLAVLFGAHATCSISMTLLNKTIAQGFDFPWTVLFIQNVGTVVIGYLVPCFTGSGGSQGKGGSKQGEVLSTHKKFLGITVPNAFKSKMWVVAQVTLFMAQLFTSLKALKYISVPLYVVARNTVPAQTALLERFFTNVQISPVAFLGLGCTVVGAGLYTYGDLQSGLAMDGFAYAVVLTLIVATCSVVDKTAVRVLGQEENIKPVECNQIRVALALPVNALFMLMFEFGIDDGQPAELNALNQPPKLDIYTATAQMSVMVLTSLLLSTLFGFGMGTFNFYLQQAVSAATVQVANILYKLSTTIISRVTHPAPVALTSWAGFALSLLGIALYTFGPKMLVRLPSICRPADATGV